MENAKRFLHRFGEPQSQKIKEKNNVEDTEVNKWYTGLVFYPIQPGFSVVFCSYFHNLLFNCICIRMKTPYAEAIQKDTYVSLNMPLSSLPHQSRSGNFRTEMDQFKRINCIFGLNFYTKLHKIPPENQQESMGECYARLKIPKQ